MRTAVTQRQDMVYFRRLYQPAFLSAPFAEWMCSKEPGADPLPLAARVHPPCRLVATVPVVLPVRQLLVFLAVASLRQPGTAWVAARSLGFPWHPRHLQGIEKPPAADASEGSMFSFVSTLTISQVKSEINVKKHEIMCNLSKSFVTFITHSVFSSNFINFLFCPAKKNVGFILFGKERLRNYASRPSHPGNLSGIVRSKNASSPVTMRLCHTLTVLSLTFTIGFFYFSPIKVKGKSVSQ